MMTTRGTSISQLLQNDFLTNKKGDPQSHSTVNLCLVRIPGSINSKCGQVVQIIHRWDRQRPAINYLLRDFRRWLINEKIEQHRWSKKMTRFHTTNKTSIRWVEKLL
jgi:hypothetical protein